MKRLIIFILTILMVSISSFSYGKKVKKQNFKAMAWYTWNEKTVSDDSLRLEFDKLKQHGIVGICVECGFNFDKVKRCAAVAHSAALEFHVWAPAMMQVGKDSTWYTINRLGKSAYNREHRAYVDYYSTLDAHNPAVVQFMVDNYTKLAVIPYVDYVQLDYIRYADVILSEGLWKKYENKIFHVWRGEDGKVNEYPGADYCYCDGCVADFKAKTGIDIKKEVAAGKDPAKNAKWAQFRCDNVTSLVNKICAAVHAKGKKISADVFPGPKSYAVKMVRQEWNKWNVDAFFPMNYNDFYLEPASWLRKITKEEVNSTKKPVYSGLFICRDWKSKANIIDPENSGLLPSEMEEAVSGAWKAGAAGVCLFTPKSMTDAHWEAFEKAMK